MRATRPDRVVRLYGRVSDLRSRWRRLSDGVVDGVWLALLDSSQLRAIDQAFYASATETVDGVERHYGDVEHIRQGLAPWERAAVSTFPPAGRVVVTAAGAGREVFGLREAGFDAVGYEPNAELVAAGRRALGADLLRHCDYDVFPDVEGCVDGVVVGWGSYMLIRGRAARARFLQDALTALRPGGHMLVSYFDRPATRYFTAVRLVGNTLRRGRVDLGDALSPNFVHYFTPAEIRAEVEGAGFEILALERAPYGHLVARRRAE